MFVRLVQHSSTGLNSQLQPLHIDWHCPPGCFGCHILLKSIEILKLYIYSIQFYYFWEFDTGIQFILIIIHTTLLQLLLDPLFTFNPLKLQVLTFLKTKDVVSEAWNGQRSTVHDFTYICKKENSISAFFPKQGLWWARVVKMVSFKK